MNSNANHVSFWSKVNPVHATLIACLPLAYDAVRLWMLVGR